jgi:hypothetical protein
MTLVTGCSSRRRASFRALVVVTCTALTLPLWLSANASADPGDPQGHAAETAIEHAAPQAGLSPTLEDLPEGFQFLPYSGSEDGGGVSIMAESGTITAGSCQYRQAVDDPHVTNNEAGVHGFWKKMGGTCPSKANVDVYLQAWGCGTTGCMWVTQASGSGDYYAGGGSGKRATAKEPCSSTRTVGWRGFVDVDLIGVSDPAGYTYGTAKDLACAP